jgi:hypothetical protein
MGEVMLTQEWGHSLAWQVCVTRYGRPGSMGSLKREVDEWTQGCQSPGVGSWKPAASIPNPFLSPWVYRTDKELDAGGSAPSLPCPLAGTSDSR